MSITSIIITKNEEKNIEDCIKSINFSNQIIVVDNESHDNTQEIAKRLGAEVIVGKFTNFSKQREEALTRVKSDWILYIDADERVTDKLREEIEKAIKSEASKDAYKIKRRNYYFGKHEWPYYAKLERLFRKSALKGWYGEIHESPKFEGSLGELEGFIDHYTHNDLTSMLDKTIEWSDKEARIRFDAGHPPMAWWRFPRVMATTFLNYYIKQRGFKAGMAGLVESIYQTYSIFITYSKLWEMQNKK